MAGGIARVSWRYLPGLRALAGYQGSWLGRDLVAGASVAAVAIPVAMAYSQLAGLPPVYGLYASLLPLLAYAVFGTSRQLIVAPDAATCAIVLVVVAPLAGADLARQVSLTATLSILTGIVCILAGCLRLGFLTNFLARPILSGYINGIAISIIAGQLGKLFGFSLKPQGFFRTMGEFAGKLGQTRAATLAVGVACFLLLRLLKRFAPRLPGPLVAMVLGILASRLLDLGGRGVALLGAIPAGLPPLYRPDLRWQDLQPLAYGAVGIALISFNSAMVTARGFAMRNRYEIDPDQEFIALGVADLGAGLLRGFAVSGADSRTAVNDSAGGKSQLAGLVAAALMVATLLCFTGPMAALPIAVLSAVLVHSALGLFDLPALAFLGRNMPLEFAVSLLTLLGVISVGVLPGVVVAILFNLLLLLVQVSRPHDALLGRVPGTAHFENLARDPGLEAVPGVLVYRLDASLLFFNADHFKQRVLALVDGAGEPVRAFVLDAGAMPMLDSTGAAILGESMDALARRGVSLVLAAPHGRMLRNLERSGLAGRLGPRGIFPSLDQAVRTVSAAAAAG